MSPKERQEEVKGRGRGERASSKLPAEGGLEPSGARTSRIWAVRRISQGIRSPGQVSQNLYINDSPLQVFTGQSSEAVGSARHNTWGPRML